MSTTTTPNPTARPATRRTSPKRPAAARTARPAAAPDHPHGQTTAPTPPTATERPAARATREQLARFALTGAEPAASMRISQREAGLLADERYEQDRRTAEHYDGHQMRTALRLVSHDVQAMRGGLSMLLDGLQGRVLDAEGKGHPSVSATEAPHYLDSELAISMAGKLIDAALLGLEVRCARDPERYLLRLNPDMQMPLLG